MLLWILLGALLTLFIYMFCEAKWLEVCRPDLPKRLGIRIAVISDLHPTFCRITAQKARDAVQGAKPDIFLFLGDALDHPAHIPHSANWLGTVTKGIPAYAVNGNHDNHFFIRHPENLETWRSALREEGIEWLSNTQFTIKIQNTEILLTALDDYRSPFPKKALPPRKKAGTPLPFHLVITHNPQSIAELPEGYADFAVAGHFHGGQIWMPFGLEFRLFRREPLGRMGIRRGLHEVNGMQLYLTRGVGNVLFPLRLGARPEITILDL